MEKIRLTAAKDRRYRGVLEYLVAYDYNAGCKDRYTVLVLNCDDPVIIGRELDLLAVRGLIADYEDIARTHEEIAGTPFYYTGERDDVLAIQRVVNARRASRQRRLPRGARHG